MKVDNDAILTCGSCGIEGPHELLYLSEHLCASRCANCVKTQVYSGHIYTEYARDLVRRTTTFPARFAGEMLRHPTHIVRWPFKALRKPLVLLHEMTQVTSFERSGRSPTHSRRMT